MDQTKASTIMEDEFEVDSNIDDNFSDAVQRDYDICKIKEKDNEFQEPAKKALQAYYTKVGNKKGNAAEAFTSQTLLAIDS